MKKEEFDSLVAGIRNNDPAVLSKSVTNLNLTASEEDFPRLLELLKDPDFVVREAAAWPLCEKAGPENIFHLLEALQLGEDEGHDNDGIQTAIVGLVELNKESSKIELYRLKANAEHRLLEYIQWLLEFCQ